MITLIILVVYIVGAIIASRRAHRDWVDEFGPGKDFVDWIEALYCSILVAIVWPLVAIFYGIWGLTRARAH